MKSLLKSLLFGSGQRRPSSAERAALTDAQVKSFFANGYLILPQFFTDVEVGLVNAAVDRAWSDRSIYNNLTISAYTGTSKYTESYIRKIDPVARKYQH